MVMNHQEARMMLDRIKGWSVSELARRTGMAPRHANSVLTLWAGRTEQDTKRVPRGKTLCFLTAFSREIGVPVTPILSLTLENKQEEFQNEVH